MKKHDSDGQRRSLLSLFKKVLLRLLPLSITRLIKKVRGEDKNAKKISNCFSSLFAKFRKSMLLHLQSCALVVEVTKIFAKLVFFATLFWQLLAVAVWISYWLLLVIPSSVWFMAETLRWQRDSKKLKEAGL